MPLGVHESNTRNNNFATANTYQGTNSGPRFLRPSKRIFYNDEAMKGWIHSHLVTENNAIIPQATSDLSEHPNE